MFVQALDRGIDLDRQPRDLVSRFDGNVRSVIEIAEQETTMGKPMVNLEKCPPHRNTLEVAHIKVAGMTCASCVQTIRGELLSHPAIARCEIALLAQRAEVEYDPDTTSGGDEPFTAEKIAQIIDSMGFEASVIPEHGVDSVELKIISTAKSKSQKEVEGALLQLPGVYEVKLDLENHRGIIKCDSNQTGVRDLIELVESLGYSATLDDELIAESQYESLNRSRELADWEKVLKEAAKCAIPVALITMVLPKLGSKILNDFLDLELFKGVPLSNILLLAFCIEMHLTAGRGFYKRAYNSLKHGVCTMDTLIVLGASTSLIFSVLTVLTSLIFTKTRGKVFFETSAMLIAFVSLGRYLESFSKKKTSKKLADLIVLFPSNSTLLTPISGKHTYLIPENILRKLPKGIASRFEFDPGSHKCDKLHFPFHQYKEQNLQTKYIQKGDLLKVNQGDRIPTDAVVVYGTTTVDESAVTGESFPVQKVAGDSVIGASINGPGFIVILATHVGRETTIAQMVKLVSNAQMSKASIQSLADAISGVFISTVLSLGLITFISWLLIGYGLDWTPRDFSSTNTSHLYVALNMAISVIVVACPCALGLATPTAMMVGTGVAAKNGIIIKGAPPLEKVSKITKIVFDKTGTLTTGRVVVVGRHHFNPRSTDADDATNLAPFFLSEAGVWNSVAAAENASEHIIGSTIAEHLKDYRTVFVDGKRLCCTVSDYKSIIGFGVKCKISPPSELLVNYPNVNSTVELAAGNRAFLISNGCDLNSLIEDQNGESLGELEKKYESRGCTLTYVSLDGQLRAFFSISDTPKPEAAATVQYLKNKNIKVCMITGDQESAAMLVAREIGIDEVYYGSTPSGKQALINKFKGKGEVIAMVGDGMNDSAPLASADLGIAVNTASGMSVEASDMVLVRQDLTGVIVAIDLSGKILRRIKINFAWAFIYNLLMIPLAAGLGAPFNITLHAMAAGFAMSLSSLSVVLSSLCLNFYTPPKIHTPYLPVCPNSPSGAQSSPVPNQDNDGWSHYFGDVGNLNRKNSGEVDIKKDLRHFIISCKLALELCIDKIRKRPLASAPSRAKPDLVNWAPPIPKKFKDALFYYAPTAKMGEEGPLQQFHYIHTV